MDSQILYLIIGVLVGAIAIYFFAKKNSGSGDNSVLSSQLADLIVRFSKVEELIEKGLNLLVLHS